MRIWSFTVGWSSLNTVSLGILLIALCTLWSFAARSWGEEPETAPSAEMLEFLGGWKTDNGETEDPSTWDPDIWEELWDLFADDKVQVEKTGETHEN